MERDKVTTAAPGAPVRHKAPPKGRKETIEAAAPAPVTKTAPAKPAVDKPKAPRTRKVVADKPGVAKVPEAKAPEAAAVAPVPVGQLDLALAAPPPPSADAIAMLADYANRQAVMAQSTVQFNKLTEQLFGKQLAATEPMSDEQNAAYWRLQRQIEAGQVENSIEAGPVRPAAREEPQAQDQRDAKQLHAVVSTAQIVMSGPDGGLTRDEAANMATDDIFAIRAIKDQRLRNLALLAAAESRHAQGHYKAEFDRQAPALAAEVDAAVALERAPGKDAAHAPEAAQPPAPTVDKAAPAGLDTTTVPEAVTRRYLKVGNEFFLPATKVPEFIDRGAKLATRGENQYVIESMVAIAKARGWENIVVNGTEAFRRVAWLEASLVGLRVDGYKPSDLDLADLARRPTGNSVAHVAERVQAAAPALALVKPAEPITLAPIGPTAKAVDPALREKAASFGKDKPTFVVKKYPDLAPAYGTLAAAAAFAKAHFPGHEERFVEIGKQILAEKIAQGQPVPGPLLNPVPDKRTDKRPERGETPIKEEVQQRAR